VGYVILVEIRGMGDGLDADAGGGDHFHILKPHVGIETFLSCFRAQHVNAARTSVIGSESEKQLSVSVIGSCAKYWSTMKWMYFTPA